MKAAPISTGWNSFASGCPHVKIIYAYRSKPDNTVIPGKITVILKNDCDLVIGERPTRSPVSGTFPQHRSVCYDGINDKLVINNTYSSGGCVRLCWR